MNQDFYDSLILRKKKSELKSVIGSDDSADVLCVYENLLSSLKAMRKNCEKFMADIGEDWFLKNKELFLKDEYEGVKGSYVLMEYGNGVKKEMFLTTDEVRVIRYAVLHNYGIINLLSRVEAIKSLMNKGLVELSEEGLLKTTSVADVIINNGGEFGYIDAEGVFVGKIGWLFVE